MELIIGFLGIFFVLYALYFFITLIISVIMGVVKAIINAIISLFTPRKRPIIQIENKKTNFLPVIKEEKKCISTIGKIPYCEQCEHCKDDGKLIFCEKDNNEVIGHYAGGEYKYRRFIVNGYKPEWCPLNKGLVAKEDNVRKEKLSDKFVQFEEKEKYAFDCSSILDANDYQKMLKYGFPTYFGGDGYRPISGNNPNVFFHEKCRNKTIIDNILSFIAECIHSYNYNNELIFFISEDYLIDIITSQNGYRGLGATALIIVKNKALPEFINFRTALCNFRLLSSFKNNDITIEYEKITSLEGCPSFVYGDFYCSNENITNLVGSPTYVVGNYFVYNNKLETLKGGPLKVGGEFCISKNNIASLEFSPKEVGDEIEIKYYNNKTSDYIDSTLPNENSNITNKINFFVGVSFDCSKNKLSNLKYCPRVINGGINCSNNELVELDGITNEINGTLNCKHNKLKTLSGVSRVLGGSDAFCEGLDASFNDIETLENMPIVEFGDIKLVDNKLSNLKGIQEIVRGNLNCRKNLIDTLKYSPKIIMGNFTIKNNMYITAEEIEKCNLDLKGDLL